MKLLEYLKPHRLSSNIALELALLRAPIEPICDFDIIDKSQHLGHKLPDHFVFEAFLILSKHSLWTRTPASTTSTTRTNYLHQPLQPGQHR
eukprot:2559614-Amphidinium_carterae.1